jgi:hypothetical protein
MAGTLAGEADGAVLWELQAASVMTADAAQATNAAEEYTRKEFTVVTLHPRIAILASRCLMTTWQGRSGFSDSRLKA